MSTIVAQSEMVRRAVSWISEASKDSGKDCQAMVEEACVKFNLSPKDAEFLCGFFAKEKNKD